MLNSGIVKEAFAGYLSINDELATELAKISEIRKFKKGEKIFTCGLVANSGGIITKGLVRSFVLDQEKEVTIWFGEDGDFITSFHSFLTGKQGFENIECIEATSILMMPIDQMKALIKTNNEMLLLYAKILECSYLYWEQRYLNSQMKEAEQRYEHFYNRSGSVVHRVPLKALSSYLNIRQETLSRIRKRWLKGDAGTAK